MDGSVRVCLATTTVSMASARTIVSKMNPRLPRHHAHQVILQTFPPAPGFRPPFSRFALVPIGSSSVQARFSGSYNRVKRSEF